jgi:hypothetical protein
MHKQFPKIEEVITFTNWLSDKQISARGYLIRFQWLSDKISAREVWNLGYIAIFGLLKQMSPQLQIL